MKKKVDPEKFCTIPFIQLQLNPLGNVSACCFSGEHKVGSVPESTIVEIWNGEEMRKWRREFMSGDIQICKGPMKTFQCHRQYHHLMNEIEITEVQERLPRRLDLRLNGKCNLECVMCDVWKQPNEMYEDSDFWSLGPDKIFPFLLEVDMLGGEPFIQKDTYRFMEEVTRVNPKCTWGFITNCNYKFTSHLEGYLDRLPLRHIHMSLDSLDPETYPLIRKNGDLAKTMATVEQYIRYRDRRSAAGRGFALMASMCVQRANWREIPQFLEFCGKNGIGPILQNVIIGNAPGREQLPLTTLSQAEKSEIIRYLSPLLNGPYSGSVNSVIAEVRSSG